MGKRTWKDYFDGEAADRAVRFFERHLHHVKGRWAGTPFVLEKWEQEIVRELFGRKRDDGSRRYRVAYVSVPRKNGKSTLVAGIALYLLFADGELGGEVYSAASDRKQAAIVFETAKAMVESAPALKMAGQAISALHLRAQDVLEVRSAQRRGLHEGRAQCPRHHLRRAACAA